jgi:hypothetical protein
VTAVAAWMLGVGLADIVAGFSGRPATRGRAAAGGAVGTIAAIVCCAGFGLGATATIALGSVSAATIAAWMYARLPEEWSQRRATSTSAVAASVVAVMLVAASRWPDPSGGWLERLLAALPFPAARRYGPETVLLVVAVVAFIQASGNALVRLILASTDSMLPPSRNILLGGRIIGPLERSLVFAFALAGEPIAATLVASAKSILRFPELSGRKDDIAALTEYFLVGSMSSWLIALAPVALLV